MKTLKALIILIIAGTTVVACQENKEENKLVFDATADGVADSTKVYLSTLTGNTPAPLDTTVVSKNKFSFDLPENDNSELAIVSFEGMRGNVIFINEGEPVKATIYKDSLRSSVIEGGKENKLFNEYIEVVKGTGKKMQELNRKYKEQGDFNRADAIEAQNKLKEEDKEQKLKLVENNPDQLVAVLILSDMINGKVVEAKKGNELYNQLSEANKNSSFGKKIKESLDRMSLTAVGSKAPDFSAPTPEGSQLSLKEAMGKVTIIDFWASWCKPCRMENPNVVKMYNEYHDKGLNIIGVSLDKNGQKDKWLKAIEDDQLAWQHVSNLQFWNEPIAKIYGVKSIPATYILDEEGNIVAKNLRGKALEDKVAEMLN